MELKCKRVVFLDEWAEIQDEPTLGPISEFQNYALGWRFEATEKELALIKAYNMWGHLAVSIHYNDWGKPPTECSFAAVLSPEWLPEVRSSSDELLELQGFLMGAAAKWTIFFDSIESPR